MKFPWPKKILMVRPNGFRVEYAINPYMRDELGNLQRIDTKKANAQWEALKSTFTQLGCEVEVIEGDPDFPDMVFCANQTFPYPGPGGEPRLVLGRMHSEKRRGETAHFREWAKRKNIPLHEVTDFDFEGCGDAIWNFEKRELICGHGFRTQEEACAQLGKIIGVKVQTVQLISEDFYHLDTCFAVLNATTAAYVREAFAPASVHRLKSIFPKLIEIDGDEARRYFAGNCLSLDGHHVVLQKGAVKFTAELKRCGFEPVEVETGEFMKSGGSVFCMKQVLF